MAVVAGWTALISSVWGDDEETLGGLLYSDPNLSLNRNQACATCHSPAPVHDSVPGALLPAPGFVDPDNVQNNTPVSRGSVSGKFGALNAPSIGYAAFSPEFQWDATDETYIGGYFWNGRAATLQEQATQPILNPAEMAMPSQWAVVTRLKENATYGQLFNQVYGLDLNTIPALDSAPQTNTPPSSVSVAFAAAAQAISQFERSRSFSKFNSKYDFWLAGKTSLSSNEMNGYALFVVKAGCSACHTSDSEADASGNPQPPLFSNFSYHNVGLPPNLNIPGQPAPDLGLGGRADVTAVRGSSELGKHKVMSLRNITLTPPYGHNGVFETLEQVVHFYNTRDVLGRVDSNTTTGFGVTGWPAPEVAQNVNFSQMGNLHLSPQEEADLVSFLKTLTDNYPEAGADPNVPPGTPSPFADTPIPQIPVRLSTAAPRAIRISGRLGQTYTIDSANSLGVTNGWQTLVTTRLQANDSLIVDTNAPSQVGRFYRARQVP
jgi:cytochrome c peroxidase